MSIGLQILTAEVKKLRPTCKIANRSSLIFLVGYLVKGLTLSLNLTFHSLLSTRPFPSHLRATKKVKNNPFCDTWIYSRRPVTQCKTSAQVNRNDSYESTHNEWLSANVTSLEMWSALPWWQQQSHNFKAFRCRCPYHRQRRRTTTNKQQQQLYGRCRRNTKTASLRSRTYCRLVSFTVVNAVWPVNTSVHNLFHSHGPTYSTRQSISQSWSKYL